MKCLVRSAGLTLAGLAAGMLLLSGCHRDMRDQAKFKPYAATDFFGDRRSVRPPVPGTVARGELRADSLLYRGVVNGKPAEVFPFPVTAEVLQRGQERFNIFCSPCHDRLGTGRGMIVQRGFRQPPSYHIDRLRQAPPGYIFGVITNGFGVMYDYAAQISPEDRWAIVAYVKALQLSQHAPLSDVPAAEWPLLERSGGSTGAGSPGSPKGGH